MENVSIETITLVRYEDRINCYYENQWNDGYKLVEYPWGEIEDDEDVYNAFVGALKALLNELEG